MIWMRLASTLPRKPHTFGRSEFFGHTLRPPTCAETSLSRFLYSSNWAKGAEDDSGWWFQPIWKILVKIGIFPKFRGENKKYLKPPPRILYPNLRARVVIGTVFSMAHLLEHAPVKRLGIPFRKGGICCRGARALGVLVVPFEWKGHGFGLFLGLSVTSSFKPLNHGSLSSDLLQKKQRLEKHTQLLPQMVVNNGDLLWQKVKIHVKQIQVILFGDAGIPTALFQMVSGDGRSQVINDLNHLTFNWPMVYIATSW